MKTILIPFAAILAALFTGCSQGVECGANCPDIGGLYDVTTIESESTCGFSGLEPYDSISLNQDASGGGRTTVRDPDLPPENQAVSVEGRIFVEEGVDPATSDVATFSSQFRHTGLNVTVSFSVSGINSGNRRISGSINTSDLSQPPCNVIRSFAGDIKR
ncbi:MAG TPA: hypothetical protein DFS52_06880 [Myxococcales bacterium]|jgi:hypothetical protein|nr:hypothetical protein [Myxococcales bacterium]